MRATRVPLAAGAMRATPPALSGGVTRAGGMMTQGIRHKSWRGGWFCYGTFIGHLGITPPRGAVYGLMGTASGAVWMELAKHTDILGCHLIGMSPAHCKVPTWRRLQTFNGYEPSVDLSCFIAPNANIIGQATLHERVGVFYGTVIRADLREVTVSPNTIIQDRCTIRCTASCDTHIGSHVTIEPMCVVSGAEIADDVFIGAQSVIMEGARIESQSVIAPGSTVQKYTVVPSGEIWAGCPAEKVRDLSDEELESIRASAIHGAGLQNAHKDCTEKAYNTMLEEEMIIAEWGACEEAREPIRAEPYMYDPGPSGSGFHLHIPRQLYNPTQNPMMSQSGHPTGGIMAN